MPASRCVRLLFMTMMAGVALQPATAQIAIGFSVTVAPPPLPIYEQPPIPGAGYIWTPGYWAWGDGGYYWVPGTWVLPPAIGLLWTPGYWGWSDGVYAWNAGYSGPAYRLLRRSRMTGAAISAAATTVDTGTKVPFTTIDQ